MAKREQKPQNRIIDNKKVLITDDEYAFFEEICKGYDRPNFNGKDLFQDHFEANENGIIIFVKPPHKKYSSLEVYTFLVSIMVNQQLRLAQDQVQTLINEAKELIKTKIEDLDKQKEDLTVLISLLKEKS
jgi:hypothetical protein